MDKFGFGIPTTDKWLLTLNEPRPSRIDKNSEAFRLALAKALLGQSRKGRPVAMWRLHLRPIVMKVFEINPRAGSSEMVKNILAYWENIPGLDKCPRPGHRALMNFIGDVRGGGSGQRLGRKR